MRNNLLIASNLLKVFFSYFSVTQLRKFREKCLCDSEDNLIINTEEFIPFLQIIQPENSKAEIRCQIEELAYEIGQESRKISIKKLLFYFSDRIIKRYNDQYKFSYEYCDIWRSTVLAVDESIFVVSKIIQEDHNRMILKHKDFSWPYCIEHDNIYISNILNSGEGVSDNHFHFKGSSPYFQLSWVSLMSCVTDEKYENAMEYIGNNRLYSKSYYSTHSIDEPMPLLLLKAAAIRLYLFVYLNDNKNIEFTKNELLSLLRAQKITIDAKRKLQNLIDKIKFKVSVPDQLDYIETNNKNSCFSDMLGERWLVYSLLRNYHSKDIEILSFIYLAIKNHFRAELIQINSLIGFNNFMLYQDRKEWFLPESDSLDKKLAMATIASVIEGPKLYSLELRVSPAYPYSDDVNLAEKNEKMIQLYDLAIKEAIKSVKKDYSLDNFYYVMHFVKQPEKIEDISHLFPRHSKLREVISKQTEGLLEMRQNYPEDGSRIHGIDACNEEMDCRPEVFAVVFRKLIYYENNPKLNQLNATYHVAEDNYDIIDGLRAIHEAMLFLGLKAGNRLGHATLLGISIDSFFGKKGLRINLPLQNLVDNYVWTYYFILENIEKFDSFHDILSYLENKYNDYVEILFNAGRTKKIKLPSINQYYQAWLLRGDAPELYQNTSEMPKTESFDGYKVCNTIPQMEKARKDPDIRKLYSLYHYDKTIRQNGIRSISDTISPIFRELIKRIQEIMRNIISKKGIGIESNPTSNVMISVIGNYSEHPVKVFFNKGLVELSKDTQLNVSVNTDDKSVFSTTISNEYAYLAFELERLKNEDGTLMYNAANIYEWIELLKRNGNYQAFNKVTKFFPMNTES